MDQIVSAVFDSEADARDAIHCLRQKGIAEDAICLGCRTDRDFGRKGGATAGVSADAYYDTYYHRTDVSDENFQDIPDVRENDDRDRDENTDGVTYVGVNMDRAGLGAEAVRAALSGCNGRLSA